MLVLDQHSTHVDVDFMYEAWINKVVLMYLPAHATHVLQPLDVTVFTSLKAKFHELTAEWSCLDVSAPIAKQNWLHAYKAAGAHAYSVSNIRAGFRACGIIPLNPARVLEKEDAFLEADQFEAAVSTATPPATPPRHRSGRIYKTFDTPSKSRDIYKHKDLLRQRLDRVDEDRIRLLFKSAKALDRKNAVIAALQAQNFRLVEEIRSKRANRRNTVKESPNDQFATMESIHEAQEALRQLESTARAREQAVTAREATRALQWANSASVLVE